MHQPPWKFNPSINQTKQFPLYFTNTLTDTVSKTLTAFGSNQQERIVYMGPRHTSSSKVLRAYALDSRSDGQINDSETYGEQEIQKYSYEFSQKQKYFPVRASQYRLFVGVNPTAKKSQLCFDSNFECGNLDLAVSLGNNQYDLFLRVDSNTKGHTCWFFFKVSNYFDRQRCRFNIVNLSRSQLLYDSGMKVYTYCSSTKQWIQDGQNIQFYPSRRVKYVNNSQLDDRFQYYTLSFEYEFKIEDQFVYFAYCIPYSYSYLNFTLNEMEKKHFKIVDIDRSNLSTGGLSIPIVTITNKNSNLLNIQSQQQTKKQVILVVGRLHPGQTQSSWILHGFMSYLCSPKAKQLRNKAIFKIIPMGNVDGVVAGNFRTGLLGRDLNRSFNHPQLIIQIGLIRSVAAMFKPIMFLDFHGHSSNKNIFAYGPDYSIDSKFFLHSRLFAKLLSKSAKAFRYYACSFKISASKKNTGRAVMMKHHEVNYSFTIQTSAFAYGTKREETIFDKYQYIQSGSLICMGLDRFVKIIFTLPKRYELQKQIESQRSQLKAKSNKKNGIQNVQSNLSIDDKKILEEIMNDEKQGHKFDKELHAGEDSDFEENNDYSEKQLKRMLTNPSQTPTIFQNKRTEKKTNKQLLAISIKQARKNRSLGSQKSMNLSIGPKLTEPSEQQFSNNNKKRLILRRKLVELTPQLQRNQSESLHMNIQSFPTSENPNINKIHIKLPKKIFSEDSCIILEDPIAKLKSLNQAGLDYSVRKSRGQYEPLSEAKRMKLRQQNQLKRRNKIKQKVEIAPYNLCVQVPRQKRQGIVQIKYSVLPMLGRSGNMDKQQSNSLMNQILQNHERSISKRVGRHAKVAYY